MEPRPVKYMANVAVLNICDQLFKRNCPQVEQSLSLVTLCSFLAEPLFHCVYFLFSTFQANLYFCSMDFPSGPLAKADLL